jgi:hypothetical protein
MISLLKLDYDKRKINFLFFIFKKKEYNRTQIAKESQEKKREIKSKMLKLFLLIVTLSSIEMTEDLNPCRILSPITYYVRYPSNMRKYIECNGSGEATVKICEKDHEYFDMSIGECRHVTSDLEEKHILESTCENDGAYSHIIYGVFGCICDPLRYTGNRCEQDISNEYRYKNHNLTTAEELLQNRFCIVDYRKHVAEKDFDRNVTYYEERFAKYNFSDQVYERIGDYIDSYEASEFKF